MAIGCLPPAADGLGLPSPHDSPRLSKEARAPSTRLAALHYWLSTFRGKTCRDSRQKGSKGNTKIALLGWRTLKCVTFVLFHPTLVSFGEILSLLSGIQMAAAYGSVTVPTNGFPESSTKGGDHTSKGRCGFAGKMHPIHCKDPQAGLLPSIASALTT